MIVSVDATQEEGHIHVSITQEEIINDSSYSRNRHIGGSKRREAI